MRKSLLFGVLYQVYLKVLLTLFLISFVVVVVSSNQQDVNNGDAKHIFTKNNGRSISSLEAEFDLFIQKYKSQSCIMEILSDIFNRNLCENLSDEDKNEIAYQLTVCAFRKIRKEWPVCSAPNDCWSQWNGDAWTTFTTFYQHIDNICFYFKQLFHEHKYEFLLHKLANSSNGILTELQMSSQIAKDYMVLNENFAREIKDSFTVTMEKLVNVNDLFSNLTLNEEVIRNNLNEFEDKLQYNTEQIDKVSNFLNRSLNLFSFNTAERIDSGTLSNVKFFIVLLCLSLACGVVMNSKTDALILYFTYFVIEKYILPLWNFGVLFSFFGCYLSRGLYVVVMIVYVIYVTNTFTYTQKVSFVNQNGITTSNKGSLIDNSLLLTRWKECLNATPKWIKKYFSRMDIQNEWVNENIKWIAKQINYSIVGSVTERLYKWEDQKNGENRFVTTKKKQIQL